jgi:acyl-CoA thioesterase I
VRRTVVRRGGVVERAYKIMNSKEQEHAVRPVVVSPWSRLHLASVGSGGCHALLAVCAVALLTMGCSPGEPGPVDESHAAAPPALEPASASETPRIVFLGDSLTAGLGVAPEQAYPALIQQRLRQAGYPDDVINAGVSGDTSAGGVRRLDWSLKGRVHVLVLALGANDGLRGLPPRQLETNLDTIIERARGRGAAVLLAGMEAPPNFGATYTRQFRGVYQALAARHHVPLIPFLLAGVAGVADLNQSDGIHPNARGHRALADLVWRQLEPLLKSRPITQ